MRHRTKVPNTRGCFSRPWRLLDLADGRRFKRRLMRWIHIQTTPQIQTWRRERDWHQNYDSQPLQRTKLLDGIPITRIAWFRYGKAFPRTVPWVTVLASKSMPRSKRASRPGRTAVLRTN